MSQKLGIRASLVFVLLSGIILVSPAKEAEQKKALTFQDIMKFKAIGNPVISEDGTWLAYSAQPDRGDGEAKIHCLKEDKVFTIERGSNPVISKNSRWVAVVVKPKAVELDKENKKKPEQGMALLETFRGEVSHFERVKQFAFSDDSRWFAYHHFKEEEKPEEEEKKSEEKSETSSEPKKDKEEVSSTLILLNLESGEEIQIPYVLSFAFEPSSQYLAYVLADPEGKDNGLYYVELSEEGWARKSIAKKEKGRYTSLTWTKESRMLAFLSSEGHEKKEESRTAS